MKSLAITTAIVVLGASPLAAIPVTMHLEGDRTLSIDFDSVDKDGVTWRLNPGDANTQRTPLSQISHIDFPPTPSWEEAEEILATGDLDAALKQFAAIAENRRGNSYPVPGNYASKALLKVLAIQRRRLDAAAIAEQARIVKREADSLTAEERKLDPVIESWIALSKKDYETTLKSLDAIENGDSEVAYLRGRALEGIGEAELSIESYAETYTLGIGDRSEMSRDALRRSVLILDALDKEERFPEVHAQLKLWAELYGAGELWPGAPEHLVKTARKELDTITGMVDKPLVAEAVPEPKPPAVPAKAAIAGTPAQPGAPTAAPVPVPAPAADPVPYEPPTLAHDLSRLEPPEDRSWILPQELDQRIYFIGQPPARINTAIETETGWAFDGESSVLAFTPAVLRNKPLRIRALFTPKTPNGILLHAGNGNNGFFGLYLVDGELLLPWRHSDKKGAKPKTFNLGNVLVDQVNSLNLTNASKTVLKGNFNGQPFDFSDPAPGLLEIRPKIDVRLSGNSGNLLINRNLPKFKGTIHFFSFGADSTIGKINLAERAMWNDKVVRFGPPPPPELPPLVPPPKE